jgi:hypothetical protein
MRQGKAAAQTLADSAISRDQLTSPYSARQSKSWEGGSWTLKHGFAAKPQLIGADQKKSPHQ